MALALFPFVHLFGASPESEILDWLRDPPRQFTQVPFWFWNGPLEPDQFRRQLRQMTDKGVYGAMPHPRFGMDRRAYLEEPFWRAMAATLDEAKKLRMQIWLYDEYNWPSGGAGGRVTDGHPEFYPRGLDYQRASVSGPCRFTLPSPTNVEPRMEVFEKYLAAFLRQADELGGGWRSWGRIAADPRLLEGDIPSGSWEVLAFYQALGRNPSPLDDGSNSMTDYLSGDSLRRFLSITHEPYYKRFRRYFGSVIPAIFTDESSTTAPAPFPWTADFQQQFQEKRLFPIGPRLPLLLESEGREAMLLRMAYWQTVVDLFSGRYLAQYAEWSRSHHLKFTGHVYDETLDNYAHAPGLFSLLRPMDFPGFDSLGPVCPGHLAKTPISVAHLENREEALCENLGLAGGWNCTLGMMRNGYNQLGWLGVSRFVPHAFFQTVENPRVECPPSFFFQNPYWKYYRTIADLSARLSCFNRIGTHVAPCLLYYPMESLWADSAGGKGQQVLPWQHKSQGNAEASQTIRVFNALCDLLPAAHWDLDVADTSLFQQAKVLPTGGNASLKVGPESFQFVLVPPVSAIGLAALNKLDAFLQAGGTVLWLGQLPQVVWPDAASEPAATLQKWLSHHTSAPGSEIRVGQGRLILLPANAQAAVDWLDQNAKPEVVLSGKMASLRLSHRRSQSLDCYLLFNDSDQWLEGAARFPLSQTAAWVSLDNGTASKLEPGAQGHPIILSSRQSAVVIFGCPTRGLASGVAGPPHPGDHVIDLSGPWEIQLAGDALDEVWDCRLSITRVQLPLFKVKPRSFQKWPGWTERDFPDQDWPQLAAVRGQAQSVEATPLLCRAVLPPGTRRIRTPLPLEGEYALWFNGDLLRKSLADTGSTGSIALPMASQPGDMLAIETVSHSGPAGLSAPLQLECGPVTVPDLKSWTEWGFAHYAGRVLYRKQFQLERKPESVWLDLGKVEHYVEVWVNGHKAGLLLWPGYTLEISRWCCPGENELVFVVANSLANRFAWDLWGTRGTGRSEPSGIHGPIKTAVAYAERN